MRSAGGRTSLVFSQSSCATYGNPAATPIAEDARQAPINPYGATKLIAEWMLRDYAAYGLKAVALRYFNAAGADPDCEIGEARDRRRRIRSRSPWMRQLPDAAFTIYGDDQRDAPTAPACGTTSTSADFGGRPRTCWPASG